MPSSPARLRRSSTFHSSYDGDVPPRRPTVLDPWAAEALAIRADFSLLLPSRRSASYFSGSLTLGPGSFFAGMPLDATQRSTDCQTFVGEGYRGGMSTMDHGRRPLDAPGLPAEEGVDLTDAEEQLAEEPEEKKNRTDGADGTSDDT